MRWEKIINGGKTLEAICRFSKKDNSPAPVTIYTVDPEGKVRTFQFKIDPEEGVIDCKKIIPKPQIFSFLDDP